MSAQINEQLAQFSNLINDYNFGSQLTAKSGLHFEKCLQTSLQNKRPTLVPLFQQNRPVDYGPKVGENNNLLQWASSGDESEVEITGMNDQRQIMDKTAAEGKGGPRIHQVVSEIIDPNWIFHTVSPQSSLLINQKKLIPNAVNYLRIEGMEPNQNPKSIFRRMLIWMDSMMNPSMQQLYMDDKPT